MGVEQLNAVYKAYAGPDRHYHGLNHIAHMFMELEEVRNTAENPAAISFAIFYHDFIYDTSRHDNEERSADAAFEAALLDGNSTAFAECVKELVLVTKHSAKYPATTPDQKLICDIDLAELATDDFTHNTELIRKEYSQVPDEIFYPERKLILRGFLESSPRIYQTEHFFKKYEDKARANLIAATAD